MTAFRGFSDRALDFYAGLDADNTKTFWTEHKSVWETEVRDPMLAMLDQLEDEFGPAKLFRPYRDVRFSKDKTPYKTHQGALVSDPDAGDGVGWYVHVDKDGMLVGGGWRAHDTAQVTRFREGVADDDGPELADLLAKVTAEGYTVDGDPLKTRPRGYPPDQPRLDLLRFRQLLVTRRLGAPRWLATPRALDEVRGAWRTIRPVTEWVAAHVGRRQ